AKGVDVIDDRRASCRNAVFQNLLDRRVEGPAFTRREPMRPPARTDSSPKKCLVRVDIADPGEERLIEQGRFDRAPAGLHDSLEFGFREIATNGLGTELRREGAGGDQLLLSAEQQPPELAWVVVTQLQPAIEKRPEVRVLDRRLFRLPHPKMPGHAEVDDQTLIVVVQWHDEIFAASFDGL